MYLKTFIKTKDPYSLTLNVDVSRQNDNTKGSEYVQYVKEVEDSLNRPGMFPLPPKGKRGYFKGYLGKTELAYKLKMNRPQLEKLINYPKDKMWPALIKADLWVQGARVSMGSCRRGRRAAL